MFMCVHTKVGREKILDRRQQDFGCDQGAFRSEHHTHGEIRREEQLQLHAAGLGDARLLREAPAGEAELVLQLPHAGLEGGELGVALMWVCVRRVDCWDGGGRLAVCM